MSNQGTAGVTSPRLSGQQYRELFEESHDAILITERDGVILTPTTRPASCSPGPMPTSSA